MVTVGVIVGVIVEVLVGVGVDVGDGDGVAVFVWVTVAVIVIVGESVCAKGSGGAVQETQNIKISAITRGLVCGIFISPR
jgi:hypothetical protein